jgi:hypothetical protein
MKLKRFSWILAIGLILGAPFVVASSQEPAPAPPQGLEIRVHVMAGGQFVDDLKLADFGLFEDGRARPISSLTLVRGGQVAYREGEGSIPVHLNRSYTLLFQIVDWDPGFSEAVEYLFTSVLLPGDAVSLITPFRPYHLQRDALSQRTKAELEKSLKDVLRKDILRGSGEYRNLVNDLKRLTKAIGGETSTFQEDMESDTSTEGASFGLETQISRYREALMSMERIRHIDEDKLLAFAAQLKPATGQKTVVMFYQREYRPELSPGTMNRLMSIYQDSPDILGSLMDLFHFYKREKTFDADKVKKAFADAGIDFHFIFVERKSQRVFGATMREQSEDVYPGFVAIARATGGTADSSLNTSTAFKLAADVSGDYYILSLAPDTMAADGAFRAFDVRVNRPGCHVTFPLGHYAK